MANAQILAVEDEKIVAENIRDRLKSLGYSVPAIVSSGEEAIKKAAETRPDLVLMDIKLKGDMDGVEAAEQIRDLFDIPVIYLTAYADDETLQRAKITDPFGYILKPFGERELHTAIELALYKHTVKSKLRENEEWLGTTLKSIGDAVIASDTKGLVIFMNPVAEALTGWKQEDALGRDLTEVFQITYEKKALWGGVVLSLTDHTLTARDGREIPIDANVAPIRDNKGSITGSVLIFRDITERKKAEMELEELTAQLQEALKAKSEFLNVISHELRTPLTGIRGAAEIIYSMPDLSREQIEEMASIVLKSVDRQERLIDDLLILARLEVERQEVNRQAIPLSQVVLDAIHSHTTVARNKGIKMSSSIPSGIPEMMLDRNMIITILNNLIGNAVKFTEPEGEISIELKLEDEDIVLSVSDTGIGIPEDELDRVFERFYQVDMSTTRRYGGTGLGLSIVKEMVELLEGDIRVESEIGEGTTFTIRLPYLPAEKAVIPSPLPTQEKELKLDKTILVVDDEPDTVRVLEVIMDKLGCVILTAFDGLEALEILRSYPSIDLIFLDLRMPVKDGYEVIGEVRQDRRFWDLPIITVSAEGREAEIERAMDLGANGHIIKPFKLEELSDIVKRWLG